MVKLITIITNFIVAAIVALSFSSCKSSDNWGSGTKGNGIVTTETRTISEDFRSIDVSASIEVIIEQSDNKSVSVEADSNLQSLIDTKVSNSVLEIKPNSSYNSTKSVIVRVKMPKIDNLSASSSSKITATKTIKSEDISISTSSSGEIKLNVESDNISCKSSSGSKITIVGKALKLNTKSSSGSVIIANETFVNEVVADASSGSSISVHPLVSLNAEASSGASINYDSHPKTVEKKASSGGNVSEN